MSRQVQMKIMTLNPRGYMHFDSEKEARFFLEKNFLPKIGINFTVEFELVQNRFVDYRGNNDDKTILVEVKNWFVRNSDMMQLMGYLDHATERYGEQNFVFYLVAGGVEEYRRKILEKLGFKIQLTGDILNVH